MLYHETDTCDVMHLHTFMHMHAVSFLKKHLALSQLKIIQFSESTLKKGNAGQNTFLYFPEIIS